MSVFSYADTANHPDADSVEPIAVNHRSAWDSETREYVDPPCGHRSGWPDTSMRSLPAECVAAGCTVGYRVEKYRGRVISIRERNMHDDSDFFATIANDDGSTFEVEYASTRGWTYFNSAQIDASEELRAKVEARQAVARREAAERAERERAELDAITPAVGALVRVKSQRSKIPAGTVGRVVWFGESTYREPSYRSRYANPYAAMIDPNRKHPGRDLSAYRVGIELDNGARAFASATVFEVLETA